MRPLEALKTITFLTMLIVTAPRARAQCPHEGLAGFGPVNASTFGYPAYYVDQNGVALGQCLDPNDLRCGLPPLPDPAAPLDVATGNFFDENLYTFVTAEITMPGGGRGILVMAVTATFGNAAGLVIPGDQVVFSRMRFRIDTPAAGIYTLTHPFGVHQLRALAPGRRSINVTDDCLLSVPPTCGPGGLNAFTTPLAPFSWISNWLVWDSSSPAAPAGYIGDPAILHKITGSPCGTNFFRIEGPGLPAGGLRTDFFSVQGKLAEICGNGVRDAHEECDDGNTADGDCCSSSCRFEAAGAACNRTCSTASACDGAGRCQVAGPLTGPCEDGNTCTTADVCTAGVCAGGPPPACPSAPVVADVSPAAASPKKKVGTAKVLKIDTPGSAAKQAFLRFDVSGLGTRPIASAKVRLQVASASGAQSNSGGQIHAISNCTWSESAMTWNAGRPAIDGPVLSSPGAVARNQVVDFDVTPALNHGDGAYCFAVDTLSTDEVDYNSREASSGRPQLLLTFADGCSCAAPTCGDQAVNRPAEQCDGRSDFACPGRCRADCTCAATPTTSTSTSTSTTTSSTLSSTPTTTVTSTTVTTTTSLLPVTPVTVVLADTFVHAGQSSTNFSAAPELVVQTSPDERILVRAQVSGLGTRTVTRAVLRLTVSTANNADSIHGGQIQRLSGCSWDPTTVTWATQPALDGTPGADVGPVALGATVDFDVTSAVEAGRDGVYCFALTTTSANRAIYNSSEAGTGRPQFVVQTTP